MDLMVKNKKLVFAFIMLSAIITFGCEKGDGDADYGFGKIYIPQATVSNGLNNYYPVPDGGGEDTYNFVYENGKLDIYLGVMCSGKISDASGFTVDVAVSSTETEEAVASGEISGAQALPSNLYTIPGKVSVESGKNSAVFFLSVDFNALMNGTYDGKSLVLAVNINNPTNFELSDTNTSVVVVIDVDAVKSVLFPEL